jgi:tetratricopeptide (TPR) repeat protein
VFFRIIEDVEAVATPFEEARESIKQTKYKNEQTSLFEELQDELSTKYNLKLYPDKLIVKLTAKEYFTKAEDSQKRRRFRDAIYYYDQIIKFYPNQQDDYKALFMKGFILAENLNEKEDALAVFEKVLNDYPENELHESARFMKNELTGKSESLKIFEE